MRPALDPARTVLWTAPSQVRIGVHPGSAVVLDGLDQPLRRLLVQLDGSFDDAALGDAARDEGVDAGRLDELLDLLDGAGVLVDRRCGAVGGPAARLEPERAALRLAAVWPARSPGGAAAARALGGASPARPAANEQARRSLTQTGGTAPGGTAPAGTAPAGVDGRDGDPITSRRACRVEVHGAGRVGSAAAVLLAAAGVGAVSVVDLAVVDDRDLQPGGYQPSDIGRERAASVQAHARRWSPWGRPACRPGDEPDADRPQLVLVAPARGHGRAVAQTLQGEGIAHLCAQVLDGVAVVGPLVVPGRTACLRCHDLLRAGWDPAWSAAVAADADAREPTPAVAMAALVAAQAAATVLAYLDGRPVPTLEATLETADAAGTTRRRQWGRHPACGCGWDRLPP